MQLQPLVSVLMTAYNREQFISEAIETVLASTYKNWELVICDDCSTDNTFQIASAYAKNNPSIRVFKNEKNLGDYPNRNCAASYAKGEFMMYVDSDDKILPDGIENLVQQMNLYPGSSFGIYSPLAGDTYQLGSTEAINRHFFGKPFLLIGPGGTIQRRSFFNEIKGYPEKYGPANDMYFNLKACCYTSLVVMPFEFMYYRRHEGQEINNASSYLYNRYLYLKDAIAELPLPLTVEEKAWIIKKNKRRFAINLVKVFFTSFDISTIKLALVRTQFTLKNFLEGIFNY